MRKQDGRGREGRGGEKEKRYFDRGSHYEAMKNAGARNASRNPQR